MRATPVKRRPWLRFLLAVMLVMLCGAWWALGSAEQRGRWLFAWAQQSSGGALVDPAGTLPEALNVLTVKRLTLIPRVAKGSSWAAAALDLLGRAAMAQGRYAQAREFFEPLCGVRYYQGGDRCQMSLVRIGRCYEAEGGLDAAARTYERMEHVRPWTPLWLEAPLYVAQSYERHGRPQEAAEAYRRAREICLSRLRQAANPNVTQVLRWHLVAAYEGLKQWADAVALLKRALSVPRETAEAKRPEMWYELARLLQERLRQPQAAQAAYRQLIEEFPQHPLAIQAERVADR